MPLIFSNKIQSPAGSALSSKINPKPFGISPLGQNQSTTPAVSASASQPKNAYGSTFQSPYAPKPDVTPQPQPQVQNQAPASATSKPAAPLENELFKNLLIQNIKGQLTDKQNQLKQQQAQEARPVEGPKPPQEAPAQTTPLYGQLIGKGQEQLQKAAELEKQMSLTKQGIQGNPNYSGSVKIGQAGLVDQNLGAQLDYLGKSGQSYLDAAGKAAPIQVPYSNQIIDPTTGQPIGGAAGGAAGGANLNNAVNQAVQLVRNGADPQGSAVQQLLSPFSAPGQQAFNNAMQQNSQGTYNPSAASAAVNQNLSQGADFQGRASSLSIPIQALDTLAPKVTEFMTTAGINPSSNQFYNDKVMDYWRQTGNPGAATQYAAYVAELQKYMGQIMGASNSFTPTEITSAVNSINPEKLSPGAFNDVMQTIKQLGQVNLSTLQQGASSSYGGGSTPYAGQPASGGGTVAPSAPAPSSALNPAPTNGIGGTNAQATWAGAVEAGPGLIGLITGSGLYKKIFGGK